jgi:hypothetical protein
MGTYDTYHVRGESGPKVECLDTSGSVDLTYTWTTVAAAALWPHDNVAPVLREAFELEEVIRTGLDGDRIVETGGFYYRATLEFPLLDKAYAGQVQTVINHCAKSGKHKVNFYPHSDNTDIYFVCTVKGQVSDVDIKGYPFAGGHSANLEIIGLEPYPEVPWPITRGMKFMDKGSWGAYSAAELDNVTFGDKSGWSGYSTAEKEGVLGYMSDTSKPVEID